MKHEKEKEEGWVGGGRAVGKEEEEGEGEGEGEEEVCRAGQGCGGGGDWDPISSPFALRGWAR